jgi:chromosome segregation ATPase
MAKRRLADLVQEEAQKETPKASVIDVTATPVEDLPENKQSDIEVNSRNKTKIETKAVSPEESTDESTHLSKADLELTIRELNELIAQVHKSEANLQKQVEQLQAALSEQKELSERSEKALAEQIARADRCEKELKDVKKTALQLAEANSELTAEIEELKQYKVQIEQQRQPQPQQKQVKDKLPAITKAPVPYRKSYGTLERLQVQPSAEQSHSSDTSSPMWLLD